MTDFNISDGNTYQPSPKCLWATPTRAHCHCSGNVTISEKPQIRGISNPRSHPSVSDPSDAWIPCGSTQSWTFLVTTLTLAWAMNEESDSLEVLSHTGPKFLAPYFLEQIQSFSNSSIWSALYAMRLSIPISSYNFSYAMTWSLFIILVVSAHTNRNSFLSSQYLIQPKEFNHLSILKYPKNGMRYL